MMDRINAAIELGGGAVDFAINTHWHFDHADGNLALARKTGLYPRQLRRRC